MVCRSVSHCSADRPAHVHQQRYREQTSALPDRDQGSARPLRKMLPGPDTYPAVSIFLSRLVSEVVGSLVLLARCQQVRLTFRQVPALPLQGVRLFLAQLLTNPVENALKYTTHRGRSRQAARKGPGAGCALPTTGQVSRSCSCHACLSVSLPLLSGSPRRKAAPSRSDQRPGREQGLRKYTTPVPGKTSVRAPGQRAHLCRPCPQNAAHSDLPPIRGHIRVQKEGSNAPHLPGYQSVKPIPFDAGKRDQDTESVRTTRVRWRCVYPGWGRTAH